MPIYELGDAILFPPSEGADEEGLVAVGGDLRPERILAAYRVGIFPWPHEDYPLLWFSPDPRLVLPLEDLHVPRRLERTIRQRRFRLTLDTAFRDVMEACATTPRNYEGGTWITPAMIEGYTRLHELGFAHSIEAWNEDELAGGLYGLSLGSMFVAESMFARQRDASKVAFVTMIRHLARRGDALFDAQIHTYHVEQFGAVEWPRSRYLAALRTCLEQPTRRGAWRLDPDLA